MPCELPKTLTVEWRSILEEFPQQQCQPDEDFRYKWLVALPNALDGHRSGLEPEDLIRYRIPAALMR